MTIKHTTALRRGCSTLAISLALTIATATLGHADTKPISFNISPKNTAQALIDFSKQARVQILFPYSAAAEFQAPALRGEYTTEVALAKLISGTNLEIASVSDKTISLKVSEKSGAKTSSSDTPGSEVIVTGTHIRGGNPTSPVRTVGRKEVDQSGYSQIGDLMRSLPENFSGGQNPGVIGAQSGNVANNNVSNASTINLRGLGTDATLVLLNGHRLAADTYYQGSDISAIPLGAVQRIEVVTDGASALYGSDAIAGVVNFILRKNYNGAEIGTRFGYATQGGGFEQTYNALAGTSDDNGYLLGSLEYSKQDAIRQGDRAFTNDSQTPQDILLQPQTRTSLFVSAGKTFSQKVSGSLDILLSERSADNLFTYSPVSYYSATRTPAYSVAANLSVGFLSDWTLRVTASAAGSRNRLETKIPAFAYQSVTRHGNRTTYVEATADGTILTLPTGSVKGAFGAGYRSEAYKAGYPGSISHVDVTRDINFLFAEMQVPLVTESATRPGLKALELSLSARSEAYSDFGQSTNPKIGLRYLPVENLTLRASWGKSFKAPSFYQMFSYKQLYIYKASAFGYPGAGNAFKTQGGNPDLRPEASTSWTLGADFSPAQLSTLKLSATYFDIDYTDRVVQPVTAQGVGLISPIYAPFVEPAPSLARQAALVAGTGSFDNYSGAPYDPATIVAVLHNEFQNAAAQRVKGIDMSYRQAFELGGAKLNAFANATWLQLKQQNTITVPSVELTGTIFNAPKFKVRCGLSWEVGAFSATGLVNYISGENDINVSPHAKVKSWTTVDANLAYRLTEASHSASSWRLSLSVSNLFDQDPPRTVYPTAFYGPHFDSTNASIVGRYVGLAIIRAW